MTLKTRLAISVVLMGVGCLAALIGWGTDWNMIPTVAAFAALLAGLAFYYTMVRCLVCGTLLGRSPGRGRKHCGPPMTGIRSPVFNSDFWRRLWAFLTN